MPLDPHAKRFLAMIAVGGGGGEPLDIAKRRQNFAMLMRQAGVGRGPTAARDVEVAGAAGPLPARLYDPAGGGAILPGLVFFHGGAFVSGDLHTHDGICAGLAEAARCRVVSVAYRLAPEHPFPAAVEDAVAATAAVAARAANFGIDPARLAIGGDSVGAGLAAIVCQRLARAGGPALRAQLLICPVLDAAGDSESHRQFGSGYFLDRATFAREMAAYGGPSGLDPDDPRVSPLRAPDLAGIPPAIIHTAEFDMVRDEGMAYASRLAAAGVPVRATCHPGMIHLFYGLGRIIPYASIALETMGQELGEVLEV